MNSVLNQNQQAAADGFFDFLQSDQKELIISGPGGVGKTFLMGHIIDEVVPRYHAMCSTLGIRPKYHSVEMTATTNKAAEVLSQATGRPASTIHSFLGLQVYNDHKTGKTTLKRGRNWQIHFGKIIFIDEASMIDRQLLKAIREATIDCKIVYVGDHCQLAPVMESISPIYEEKFPFYHLTEPMRNAEQPALMEVCSQLRASVESLKFQPIKIVPGVIDHCNKNLMQDLLREHFLEHNQKDRILAYTNKRVLAYNHHIRHNYRHLPPHYTQGELLVNNTAIASNNGMLQVEEEIEILHIEEPTMVEIEPGVELKVAWADVQGNRGQHHIPIPVNKEHFILLAKHYKKQKDWPNYYKLIETYPDLRPRDAATIHKAQGSTYDTVFIDLTDLSTCHRPDMAARLLYVAFTRAKERVILYGDLASKYGGLSH